MFIIKIALVYEIFQEKYDITTQVSSFFIQVTLSTPKFGFNKSLFRESIDINMING